MPPVWILTATLPRVCRRVIGAWIGLTGYVLVSASLIVFPSYVPFSAGFLSVQIGLTVVVSIIALVLMRTAPRPLLFFAAIPLFAVAAFDFFKACPGIACETPPGYEPWRHLKVFVRWTLTGPALGISNEPYQCATACPYRIEVLPLFAGYVAIWLGLSDSD